MTEEEQLTALCRRLGAAPGQDALMARKLLQRAEQMAAERSIEKVQALRYLLELMTTGRDEDESAQPAPRKGSGRAGDRKNKGNGEENR
ncbi:MAG: hypothetical protein GVY10_07035 [Verrucomicrobia bacterium]|jgi:hypothetical protein|nr:hypothetical protein [Verrucomicrobiota bacterium]